MSFRDRAMKSLLGAARALEEEAARMAIVRSLDATESAKWLREIAQALRAAATDDGADAASDCADAIRKGDGT